MTHRKLTSAERDALISNGCTATDWNTVQVEDDFDPTRVDRVDFVGQIKIGGQTGVVESGGVKKPAGLSNATIINCRLGPDVRIANVRVHLANYDIGANTCIEDIGTLATNSGAMFGNGVAVDVLNEGGGREVILFNELSAQFAYLACLHRFHPALVERLTEIAQAYAAGQRSDRGAIGRGVTVRSVNTIENVNVGDGATICGTARLHNGTVLSALDAPTSVGADVQAEDFVFAEGANVTDAALLSACFVGQGCQIGRQFSAENCLFFANCEGFHGEAVSVFAGPYTVTHHKSTLLIAGLFSFYNAGSGTNQSNHMYKLGPVHEGKLERGCKTGSFSYMMWPCRVGPFSVVLGKHKRHFDTSAFPFSLIEANAQGHCAMVPGLNLTTVGTVRDGAKWPVRDRRKGSVKRDRISFDVLSPFTVGRMIKASGILARLRQETEKSVNAVTINGATVKRVLLRTGEKFYRTGIEIYLIEQIVRRAEQAITDSRSFVEAFQLADGAVYSEEWVDVSGQLMPRKRLDSLTESVLSGRIPDVTGFFAAIDRIDESYDDDQWAWARHAYERLFECDLDELAEDDLDAVADALLRVKSKFLKQVSADAQKEFEDMTGFGHGGVASDVEPDFIEVRGTYEQNTFVTQMQEELETLESRISKFKATLKELSQQLS